VLSAGHASSKAPQALPREQANAKALVTVEAHLHLQQLAFWSSWQTAILRYSCAADGDQQLPLDDLRDSQVEACLTRETALKQEIAALQRHLGGHVSTRSRLEASLTECLQAKRRLEAELTQVKASYAQVRKELDAAQAASQQREEKLNASLNEAASGRAVAEQKLHGITAARTRLEGQLVEYVTSKTSLEAMRSELERRLAATASELSTCQMRLAEAQEQSDSSYRELRSKYERAKTKLAESVKLVAASKQEKDALLKQQSRLEGKLADVETFLRSDSGQQVRRLEDELATVKLTLAEAEADKDELEVQLSGMRARAALARSAMSKDADGRRTSA
jgi:chromosome segregation ATPase